jgi:release factor glutamine methyltransferase
MEIKKYRNHFNNQLSDIYPQTEIDSFFFLLIEKEVGFKRIDLVLNSEFVIPESKLTHFKNVVSRLKNQEPIQYILGETEFYGLPFKVTKDTLIPRPETEELVEWILNEIQEKREKRKEKLNISLSADEQPLTILDIGTGSGCIPISLAKNLPNATITSIDISCEAIKIAKKNAELNNVLIDFIEQDILKTNSLNFIMNEVKQSVSKNERIFSKNSDNDTQFDIIVSNPPYVRELEKAEIKPNVLENEPHVALFVDDHTPLVFYSKIADLAKKHLKKKGVLYFEINQYLGKETIEMLTEKGFTTELKKDLFGNDRMTKSILR